MGNKKTIRGECLCRAVKIEIYGVEPAHMGYCHCESCRKAHSAPLVPLIAFPINLEHGFADKEGKFKVSEGADLLASYHHTRSGPRRAFCKRCGTSMFNATEHNLLAVSAPVIAEDVPFKPEDHIFYEERVLLVPDGLPKYRGHGPQTLEDGDNSGCMGLKGGG